MAKQNEVQKTVRTGIWCEISLEAQRLMCEHWLELKPRPSQSYPWRWQNFGDALRTSWGHGKHDTSPVGNMIWSMLTLVIAPSNALCQREYCEHWHELTTACGIQGF